MFTDAAATPESNAKESNLLTGARHLIGRLFGKHEDADPGNRRLSSSELRSLRQRFAACAAERGGVVSARQRAVEIGQIYSGLDEQGRRDYLRLLALEFGPRPEAVDAAMKDWKHAVDTQHKTAAEMALREALRSQRLRILTQFSAIPQGVKFLVEMRDDLLRFVKGAPELGVVESELFSLLSTWFDVDFLQLQRISWNSSAALLEKLIKYEAVHQIRSWADLRNRLDSDRRCYGLFHPRMPDEPLIFVEVALTDRLSDNIQVLLDESLPPLDPTRANTAIFYSISNTQPGLRGLNFGNFLIKRVVDDLARDFPTLKTFSTLSPIPGFMSWLKRQEAYLDRIRLGCLQTDAPVLDAHPGVAEFVASGSWYANSPVAQALQPVLLEACAHYLTREKSQELPQDPVARFHLVNGARIERVNWLADRSDKGFKQSAGMMVNYLYRKAELESNHEKLMLKGAVSSSRAVRSLLQSA
ncbi:malonyl-CoA decarboxylase [Noviherbaspirillum sp.]|jgi:malonyl-CoA decarboxylase|uniref:malonyl-CoA decarboxylase n=1 Tax=Noviherbaspirillum sp. TaxID=1926288 RepID=UPI0025EC821D|nr:malonyl-CoA decarboxylase [Noviherbaspirillum sp.]